MCFKINATGPDESAFLTNGYSRIQGTFENFVIGSAVLACFVMVALGTCRAAEDSARPNIILVMADDQGWGDVGYNGHPLCSDA